MRYGVCCFSGHGVQYGKGRILVMTSGSSFLLGSRKARSHFQRKMDPKNIAWTGSSRTARKKGGAEKEAKRKGPQVVKSVRSFVGMSLEELKQKMHKPEAPGQAPAHARMNKKREKIKAVAAQQPRSKAANK